MISSLILGAAWLLIVTVCFAGMELKEGSNERS
jgi:hypothetical protein